MEALIVTAENVVVMAAWAFGVTMVGVVESLHIVAAVVLLVGDPVPVAAGGGGVALRAPMGASGGDRVVCQLGVG